MGILFTKVAGAVGAKNLLSPAKVEIKNPAQGRVLLFIGGDGRIYASASCYGTRTGLTFSKAILGLFANTLQFITVLTG